MQEEKPLIKLWNLASSEHSKLKLSIVIAIIGVLAGIVPYFAVAKIIIEVLNESRDENIYILWCIIAVSGYILKTVLYSVSLAISHKSTFNILKEIRENIIKKLPKLPLGTVMNKSSGELKQIIVDQVESMEIVLAHLLPEMTSNILGPVVILIYLFILDWRMAIISIISIPLGMLFMIPVFKNYPKQYEESVIVSRKMNSTIVEYIGGIEVIKTFNQAEDSYKKYADRIIANAKYFCNWMKSAQFPMAVSKNISPTTLITVLPIGWILYSNGSLEIGVFITTIILSLGIAGPLLAAMDFVDSLARIGTIVDSAESLLNAEEQLHSSKNVNFNNYDIEVENISFGYDEDKKVIENISLNIKEGDIVAFVGPSGSGKSTIAKLIAGFWDVKEGRIKLGNIDLKNIPLEQLYDQIAFVTQDNYLFDETIMENIRMGNMKASDQEVIKVAKLANCDYFIKNLEKGYNTLVGGKGAHLSGGERQRISIARAMLKNSPIVILDEATAYIDPENEAIIQNAIAKLVRGKTVIIIAHKLSTITDADKIFLIENGKLSDSRKHKELLDRSKLYKDMWNSHIKAKEGVKND